MDRPILFSGPMVRAILQGSKTQTRRILKPQPLGQVTECHFVCSGWSLKTPDLRGCTCQEVVGIRWQVGDRLWVRETYYQQGHWEPIAGCMTRKGNRQKWQFVADSEEVVFDPPDSYRKGMHKADPETSAWHKRLGRFMPRRYSRIKLEVTGVRVERLWDISDEDCIAEGINPDAHVSVTLQNAYSVLWETINGFASWEANPVVVVRTFRRVADV